MLDILFAILAMGAQSIGAENAPAASDPATAPGAVVAEETPVTPASGSVAEPQVPTGKFTTAVEVRPILTATRNSWVAVREFNGQDLVYVTQLWSWRCGLVSMSIGLNDEPLQNWPLPPCHEDTAVPNAILEADGLPYLTLKLGSVQRVVIEVTYDDLTTDRGEYLRADVLMP